MKPTKVIPIAFIIIMFISTLVLVSLCMKMFNLLNDSTLSFQLIQVKYNTLQKQTNLTSIILFIVLLVIGFANYYVNHKIKYIAWANLLYVPVTLFNYITLNYNFYKMQGSEPNENSGFWLIMFIGVFYIIGAVLVSIIGTFTIRNLNKRLQQM